MNMFGKKRSLHTVFETMCGGKIILERLPGLTGGVLKFWEYTDNIPFDREADLIITLSAAELKKFGYNLLAASAGMESPTQHDIRGLSRRRVDMSMESVWDKVCKFIPYENEKHISLTELTIRISSECNEVKVRTKLMLDYEFEEAKYRVKKLLNEHKEVTEVRVGSGNGSNLYYFKGDRPSI